MKGIDGLMRKFNETNNIGSKYISQLQREGINTLTVGKALVNLCFTSSAAMNSIIETAAKQSQNMRNLFLTRAVTGLPPIFEIGGDKLGEGFISGFKSLQFLISWRITPLARFAESSFGKIKKKTKELSAAEVLQQPTIFHDSLVMETMERITDYADATSRFSQRATSISSAVATRLNANFSTKTAMARDLLDNTKRMAAKAFNLAFPAAMTAPSVKIKKFFSAISKVSMVPQSMAKRASETYGAKVFGEMYSNFKAVSENMANVYSINVPTAQPSSAEEVRMNIHVTSMSSATALPNGKAGRRNKLIWTIQEIKKVASLITEKTSETYGAKVFGEMYSNFKAVSENMANVYSINVPTAQAPLVLEAAVKRIIKAPNVGFSAPLRTHQVTATPKAIEVLSGEGSRINRKIFEVMRERYLGAMTEAPAHEHIAIETVSTDTSVIDRSFYSAGADSKSVPREVIPFLEAEASRAKGSYMGFVSDASRVFNVLGAVSRKIVALGLKVRKSLVENVRRADLEGTVLGVVKGPIVKPMQIDAEKLGLERASLGFPGVVRGAKFNEIASNLFALQPTVASSQKQSVIKNVFNVTVAAASLEDDSDLRSLERKIRRILEREARRYGVST